MIVIGTTLVTNAMYFSAGVSLTVGLSTINEQINPWSKTNTIIELKQELRAEKLGLTRYKTKDGGYVYIRGSAEDVKHLIMRDKWGDKYLFKD